MHLLKPILEQTISFELLDLVVISVEKLEESSLCARGALTPRMGRFSSSWVMHAFVVHKKILHP